MNHVLSETAAFGAAEENVTIYQIDNLRRMTHVTLPDTGTGSPVYETVYNAAG